MIPVNSVVVLKHQHLPGAVGTVLRQPRDGMKYLVASDTFGHVFVDEGDMEDVTGHNFVPNRSTLNELVAELTRQGRLWGKDNDDRQPLARMLTDAKTGEVTHDGWLAYIETYARKAWRERPGGPDDNQPGTKGTRQRLIQVAALALSAVEAIDRVGVKV